MDVQFADLLATLSSIIVGDFLTARDVASISGKDQRIARCPIFGSYGRHKRCYFHATMFSIPWNDRHIVPERGDMAKARPIVTPTEVNDASWRTQFSGVLVGGWGCLTLAAMLIASWPFEFLIYLPLFVASLAAGILLLALKRTLHGCILLAISIAAPLLLYLASGMSAPEFVQFLRSTGA